MIPKQLLVVDEEANPLAVNLVNLAELGQAVLHMVGVQTQIQDVEDAIDLLHSIESVVMESMMSPWTPSQQGRRPLPISLDFTVQALHSILDNGEELHRARQVVNWFCDICGNARVRLVRFAATRLAGALVAEFLRYLDLSSGPHSLQSDTESSRNLEQWTEMMLKSVIVPRVSDVHALTRLVALEAVGQALNRLPGFTSTQHLNMIELRLTDKHGAVRERAIKLLAELCISSPAFCAYLGNNKCTDTLRLIAEKDRIPVVQACAIELTDLIYCNGGATADQVGTLARNVAYDAAQSGIARNAAAALQWKILKHEKQFEGIRVTAPNSWSFLMLAEDLNRQKNEGELSATAMIAQCCFEWSDIIRMAIFEDSETNASEDVRKHMENVDSNIFLHILHDALEHASSQINASPSTDLLQLLPKLIARFSTDDKLVVKVLNLAKFLNGAALLRNGYRSDLLQLFEKLSATLPTHPTANVARAIASIFDNINLPEFHADLIAILSRTAQKVKPTHNWQALFAELARCIPLDFPLEELESFYVRGLCNEILRTCDSNVEDDEDNATKNHRSTLQKIWMNAKLEIRDIPLFFFTCGKYALRDLELGKPPLKLSEMAHATLFSNMTPLQLKETAPLCHALGILKVIDSRVVDELNEVLRLHDLNSLINQSICFRSHRLHKLLLMNEDSNDVRI